MESGRIVTKVVKVVDISPAEALSRIAKFRSELQAKAMDENDIDDLTGKYDILVNDMELSVGADTHQFAASQSDASLSPVKSPKKKRKHSQEEEKIEDASSVGSLRASNSKRKR